MKRLLTSIAVIALAGCANPCAGRDNCSSVNPMTSSTEIVFYDFDKEEVVETWPRIGGWSALK